MHHQSLYSPTSDKLSEWETALLRDLRDTQRKEDSCDVTIVCEGRTFRVHSFVLRMRSDVFDAMLGTDMKERRRGKIKVTDVKARIMEAMLS